MSLPRNILNLLQCFGFTNRGLDIGYYLSAPESDYNSLFIKDSAGSIIIRQSSYPTASGGLGDVYKCTRKRDTISDEVAVKTLRFANLSDAEVAKVNKSINREIKIWGRLDHHYVLPFYGTVQGFSPFRALVSPWMPNGNLNSYLNRPGLVLTEMDRFNLLTRIAEGLKYLHDENVIHGDFTSNNVLIAADGSPRLADFGISNIMRQSDATFSFHAGAVRWIAPECMAIPEDGTMQCGTKSGDIYALGCIILEVLYGLLPYWWIKSAVHVFSAKFSGQGPIQANLPIQIKHNHLKFMKRCWSDKSSDRPSVDDVLAFLDSSRSPNLSLQGSWASK